MKGRLSEEQLNALRAVPLGTLTNRLQIAFAIANVRQADACAATGLSAPTLSKLVRGSYQTLAIENARALAEFFGSTIEDLFPSKPQAVAS